MNLAVLALKLAFPLIPLMPPDVGARAHYQLSHDRNRTTPLVQDAALDVTIVEVADEKVILSIDYFYKLMTGDITPGGEIVSIPIEAFAPGNLDKLRNGEVLVTPEATFVYSGIETITINGLRYVTDVLRATNVKSPLPGLTELTGKVYLSDSIPVLGVVRVDVAGLYNRLRVKASVDYMRLEEYE